MSSIVSFANKPLRLEAAAAGLWLALAAAGAALKLGWLRIELLEAFPLCAFKALTGIECPGCGMGHSLLAAFGGDFQEAFALHPLGPIVLFIWTAWLLPSGRKTLRALPRAAAPAAAAAILAVYAARLLA